MPVCGASLSHRTLVICYVSSMNYKQSYWSNTFFYIVIIDSLLNFYSVLGHEGIGEVIFSKRIQNGLPTFYPGERVVFSVADFCDTCQMCKAEMPECCSSSTRVTFHVILFEFLFVMCMCLNIIHLSYLGISRCLLWLVLLVIFSNMFYDIGKSIHIWHI